MSENFDHTSAIAHYNSALRTHMNELLKEELKRVGNSDLVPSHGSLLHVVYKHNGRVQISKLYHTLLKQKSTITEMIKRLVKLGYLVKERSSDDGRVTYVVATEKALSFQKDFEEISKRLLERVYYGFSVDESKEFTRLMRKAIDNF